MLFNMPKVTFFVRSNNDTKKTHVLYCRVTHQGTKKEFSLSEKIDLESWDQKRQFYFGSKKQSKFISSLMETTSYNIKTASLYGDFKTAGEIVRALSEKRKPEPTIIEIVDAYILNESKTKSKGTIRNHGTKRKNLLNYEKYCKRKFYPSTFDVVEAERFKKWFKESKRTNNVSTASRNVSFYAKAMEHAQKLGEIKKFELSTYKGEGDSKKEVVFLTKFEVSKLEVKKFQSAYLGRVRDLFLFQCYTGLSYGDIHGDWIIEEKHEDFVIGSRCKNNQRFFFPLSMEAKRILEKYNWNLPKYVNSTYNRMIKEVIAMCDINKHVTSHTGRKTFASIKDQEGWSIPSISKMLGQKRTRTTEDFYLGDSIMRVVNESHNRK